MDFEPSDWKKTRLPQLSQLDSLQRCLICKDFLKAPVITSCNHTFCSQCIRQHLMSVSLCPLCKAEQFESNLKRVILLEEIVLCYQALRNELISLVSRQDTSDEPTEKKKEIAPDSYLCESIEIIEIPDDSSWSPAPTAQAKLDPGYVHCPVCGQVMKEEHVQGSHLDYCLNGKPDPKLAPKKSSVKRKANDVVLFFLSQKRQKPVAKPTDHENFYFNQGEKHHHDAKGIPKIDFASLSTAKVKEKLAALKLSTLGSRTELEWRYNHYYLLHQSNLDSNRPQSELELRQKLKQWEVSQHATSNISVLNAMYGDSLSRKKLSDKDFPIKTWLEVYKDEFKGLVKQAKKSRKRHVTSKGISDIPQSLPDPEKSASKEESSMKSTTTQDPEESTVSEKPENQAKAEPEADEGEFDFRKSFLFAPQ